MKSLKLFFALSTLLFVSVIAQGQSARCQIGTTNFACPKYFKQINSVDPTIRIFRSNELGNELFLFMSVPSSSFGPDTVTRAIAPNIPKARNETFRWTDEKDPLFMEMDTKYKYDLVASFGLSSKMLVEVKAFSFEVAGKKLVLGYWSDLSETPMVNRRIFETGRGISDNASGCNAVVTALNSVTKEFKEKEQGCTLSGIAN